MADRSKMYDAGKKSEAEAKPEAAPATEEKPAAAAPAAEVPDPYEEGRKMREAMLDAHDIERRDMHGNHRTEHKKMAARHEKAIKALHDAEMKRLAAVETPTTESAEPAKAGGASE